MMANNLIIYNLSIYNLSQLWQSDQSSSFFIQIELRCSSTGQPFCPHVIFHTPFESESHAE